MPRQSLYIHPEQPTRATPVTGSVITRTVCRCWCVDSRSKPRQTSAPPCSIDGVDIDAVVIRPAEPEDAAGVQAIYAPIVEHTVISFEYDIPSVDEMRRRIEHTTATWPWLVAEAETEAGADGVVVGYAYGTEHSSRQAYQW